MLFIGVLKEADGVVALTKVQRQELKAKEWRDFICTSCLHGSFTAVWPFNYVSQNSVVVSVQNKNMAEGSCVNPRSAERIFSLLATMFGDQQHETLEEYIAAALILHVSNRYLSRPILHSYNIGGPFLLVRIFHFDILCYHFGV